MNQREGGQAQPKNHDVSPTLHIEVGSDITVLIGLPHALASHMRAQPCVIVRIEKRMAEFFATLSQTTAVVARMERSEIRGSHVWMVLSRIALRSIRATSRRNRVAGQSSLVSKIKRSAPPLANFGTSAPVALPSGLANAAWMSAVLSKVRMATR